MQQQQQLMMYQMQVQNQAMNVPHPAMRQQGLVPPVFVQPQLQGNIQVNNLNRRQDPILPQPVVRQPGLDLPAVAQTVPVANPDRRRQEPNDGVAPAQINPEQPVGRQEVAVLPAINENQDDDVEVIQGGIRHKKKVSEDKRNASSILKRLKNNWIKATREFIHYGETSGLGMIIDPMSNKPIFSGKNGTVFEVANTEAFRILENILYQNYKKG